MAIARLDIFLARNSFSLGMSNGRPSALAACFVSAITFASFFQ
jgi:hypothetical protein